jgi:hypothetical protein
MHSQNFKLSTLEQGEKSLNSTLNIRPFEFLSVIQCMLIYFLNGQLRKVSSDHFFLQFLNSALKQFDHDLFEGQGFRREIIFKNHMQFCSVRKVKTTTVISLFAVDTPLFNHIVETIKRYFKALYFEDCRARKILCNGMQRRSK